MNKKEKQAVFITLLMFAVCAVLLSAVGGGTAAALLFHFLRFEIPFPLMFFLSIAGFYFLLRVFGLLRRK